MTEKLETMIENITDWEPSSKRQDEMNGKSSDLQCENLEPSCGPSKIEDTPLTTQVYHSLVRDELDSTASADSVQHLGAGAHIWTRQ